MSNMNMRVNNTRCILNAHSKKVFPAYVSCSSHRKAEPFGLKFIPLELKSLEAVRFEGQNVRGRLNADANVSRIRKSGKAEAGMIFMDRTRRQNGRVS
jgi:hypothetical protein